MIVLVIAVSAFIGVIAIIAVICGCAALGEWLSDKIRNVSLSASVATIVGVGFPFGLVASVVAAAMCIAAK